MMNLFAVAVFYQTSIAIVFALTEPNCTVKQDVPCYGHTLYQFENGIGQEILDNLSARFCGCVHVIGNIRINLQNFNFTRQLTADDFNMFYHLEQVSGTIYFLGIPDTSDMILPNLKIIRAEELEGKRFSLLVRLSNIKRFILPRLTEISRGDVLFENTGELCNYLTVNWRDIIDGGGDLVEEGVTCNPMTMSNFLPDCQSCSSWHCWTEDFCQTLTKDCNGCGQDRCYAVNAEGTKQCCSSLCAAGCDGPTATHCFACKNFDNNGTCVSECPPELIYDRSQFRLVSNPDFRLSLGYLCVTECPSGLFQLQNACVQECPASYTSSEDRRACEQCNGLCPRECAGLGLITDLNIRNYNGCTIISSGSISIGNTGFNYSKLEFLSDIQEIRGPLRIQSLPTSITSFPYLRNLRKIDTSNATVELFLLCRANESAMSYAFELLNNPGLMSIDLSSLVEIRGGGLRYAFNPQLCYTGYLPSYLADPENQFQCVGYERRHPSECISASMVCHPQCNSTTDCWGPEDHQCDSCTNYKYQNRCIQNCSVVTATLPADSSGLFQNEASLLCEACDQECVGECFGGTGPQHCRTCRNFFIRTSTSEAEGMLCVSKCPVGTYLNNGTTECIPCHEGCKPATGCAGPLPYLDPGNGCLDCDTVLLIQNRTQENNQSQGGIALNPVLKLCAMECPNGFVQHQGACVLECPVFYTVSGDRRFCEPCNGPCPKVSTEVMVTSGTNSSILPSDSRVLILEATVGASAAVIFLLLIMLLTIVLILLLRKTKTTQPLMDRDSVFKDNPAYPSVAHSVGIGMDSEPLYSEIYSNINAEGTDHIANEMSSGEMTTVLNESYSICNEPHYDCITDNNEMITAPNEAYVLHNQSQNMDEDIGATTNANNDSVCTTVTTPNEAICQDDQQPHKDKQMPFAIEEISNSEVITTPNEAYTLCDQQQHKDNRKMQMPFGIEEISNSEVITTPNEAYTLCDQQQHKDNAKTKAVTSSEVMTTPNEAYSVRDQPQEDADLEYSYVRL